MTSLFSPFLLTHFLVYECKVNGYKLMWSHEDDKRKRKWLLSIDCSFQVQNSIHLLDHIVFLDFSMTMPFAFLYKLLVVSSPSRFFFLFLISQRLWFIKTALGSAGWRLILLWKVLNKLWCPNWRDQQNNGVLFLSKRKSRDLQKEDPLEISLLLLVMNDRQKLQGDVIGSIAVPTCQCISTRALEGQ